MRRVSTSFSSSFTRFWVASTRLASSFGAVRSSSAGRGGSRLQLAHRADRAPPVTRHDAAHARGDAALGGDLEEADVAGAAHVGAAAELRRVRVHAAPRAPRRRTSRRTAPSRRTSAPPRASSPRCRRSALSRIQPLTRSSISLSCSVGQRLEVREVEAQAVGRDHRARLLHVLAEHLLQRLVEQVGRRVVGADGVAPLVVDRRAATTSPTCERRPRPPRRVDDQAAAPAAARR